MDSDYHFIGFITFFVDFDSVPKVRARFGDGTPTRVLSVPRRRLFRSTKPANLYHGLFP